MSDFPRREEVESPRDSRRNKDHPGPAGARSAVGVKLVGYICPPSFVPIALLVEERRVPVRAGGPGSPATYLPIGQPIGRLDKGFPASRGGFRLASVGAGSLMPRETAIIPTRDRKIP